MVALEDALVNLDHLVALAGPVADPSLGEFDVLLLRLHLGLIRIPRLGLGGDALPGDVGLLVDFLELRTAELHVDLLGNVTNPLVHRHVGLEVEGRPAGAFLDLLVGELLLPWPTSNFMRYRPPILEPKPVIADSPDGIFRRLELSRHGGHGRCGSHFRESSGVEVVVVEAFDDAPNISPVPLVAGHLLLGGP